MRNVRKSRAISLAAAAVFGLARPGWAAVTVTWTGATSEATSIGYPVNTAAWDTTTQNWANGSGATTYAAGDNTVFTDNFTGDVSIAVSGGMNPSSMEFTNTGAGAFTSYTFLTGTGTTASSSPFQASNYPQNLILDSNFNGIVHLQANASATGQQFSQIAINGGTLEVDTTRAGAFPYFTGTVGDSFPAITLSTGTLSFNDSSGASAQQLDGLLNVTASSTIATGTLAASNKPEWSGTIDIASGDTLTMSSASSSIVIDLTATGISGGTIAVSPTTVLDLSTAGSGSKTTVYALGASGTIETGVAALNLGALTGGTGSTLTNTGATVYSIGADTGSTFSGTIADGTGTTGITKVNSANTLTLNGTNTFTGATTVNAGTLLLDFSASGAPATNIINNSANSSTLNLSGGTLALTGKASTTNSQRFAALSVNTGASAIVLNANATSNPLLLTLGAITPNGGGTVDFTLPTGVQSGTNGIVTTTANAIPTGGQQTILGGYATVNGNTWAVSGTGATAGNITGLATGSYSNTGTTALASASGLDIDIAASGTNTAGSSETVNSIRFNDGTGPSTINAAAGLTVATAEFWKPPPSATMPSPSTTAH